MIAIAESPLAFVKYQALGNDYLVIDEETLEAPFEGELVRRMCDRHLGAGSDGILLGAPTSDSEAFRLRILNPDGSQAEKSGNGLRIFARYLFDCGRVAEGIAFVVETAGGNVRCLVSNGGDVISVAMGPVRFSSTEIPVIGPAREVLRERIVVPVARAETSTRLADGTSERQSAETLEFSAATIGNPHCVVVRDEVSEELAERLGPGLETHPFFPNRTNVQFVRVAGPHDIEVQIWERGAGHTLASGSSASASAAVCVRLGLCQSPVSVSMPGGTLEITIAEDFEVSMVGPAQRVYSGTFPAGFVA